MTNSTDMVLKSKGGMRGRRCPVTKGGRVEAWVSLGGDYESYGHPWVTLQVTRTWDGTGEEYGTTLVTIKFQRNRVIGEYDVPARGFMKGPYGRTYSGSYAGYIEGRHENLSYVAAGLRILERAHDVISEDDKLRGKLHKRNDALLSLIVGLRKIGVTVVLRDMKRPKEYQIAA